MHVLVVEDDPQQAESVRHLHGDPYRTPQAYSASPEVTLLVLPDTKHNHFVYPSRTHLFERLANWAENLP